MIGVEYRRLSLKPRLFLKCRVPLNKKLNRSPAYPVNTSIIVFLFIIPNPKYKEIGTQKIMKCKKGQYLDAKKLKREQIRKKGIFGFHDHNNRHGYSKDLN